MWQEVHRQIPVLQIEGVPGGKWQDLPKRNLHMPARAKSVRQHPRPKRRRLRHVGRELRGNATVRQQPPRDRKWRLHRRRRCLRLARSGVRLHFRTGKSGSLRHLFAPGAPKRRRVRRRRPGGCVPQRLVRDSVSVMTRGDPGAERPAWSAIGVRIR